MRQPHNPVKSIQNISLKFLHNMHRHISLEDALRKTLADLEDSENELIIWNGQTGNYIGDSHRIEQLIHSGCTEIQCAVIDLNERQEKALNTALNKIGGKPTIALLFELLYYLDQNSFGNECDITV